MRHHHESEQVLSYLVAMQGPGTAARAELDLRRERGGKTCPECRGWGFKMRLANRCETCDGAGTVYATAIPRHAH